MKVCRKCKLEKDESEFSKDKSRKDGLYSHCKACWHAYYQTDAYKYSRKAYRQTDAFKALRKAYRQTYAYKKKNGEYQKAYYVRRKATASFGNTRQSADRQ